MSSNCRTGGESLQSGKAQFARSELKTDEDKSHLASSVNVPQHKVEASHDGDDVGDEHAFEQDGNH